VVNKKDDYIKVYISMYAAAKDINIKYSRIVYYANKDKLLKNIYLIKTESKYK
jgi:NUMOD1 domain